MRMRIFSLLSLIAMTIFTFPALGSAGEKTDHVCFRSIDSDKDGAVTFEEFVKYFGKDQEKFKTTDLDGNGKLTHDEYHKLLGHGST
jgi:hypothetical protein